MSYSGGTVTTPTAPGVCNVNDYLTTINAILVQLLDKKDKKQTLERLANLKEEIVATLRAPQG